MNNKKVPFHDPRLPETPKAPPMEMHWICKDCGRRNYQHHSYCTCGTFKPSDVLKKKNAIN